jgi:hypothetical protein
MLSAQKKNKLELVLTGLLVLLLVLLVMRGWRSPPKRPLLGPVAGSLKVQPAEELSLFGRLDEQSKNLELKRDPFFASPITQVRSSSYEGISLSGIMYDAQAPAAVINGKVVKEGDSVAGNIVLEIMPNKVILSDGSRNLELNLK